MATFVVSWQSAGQDVAGGDAIVARRYSATGTALANEFIVNQFTAGNQSAPSVSRYADGSFVIAWQSAGQDVAGGDAIVARRYSSTGVALANEFIVNQFTAGNQSRPEHQYERRGFRGQPGRVRPRMATATPWSPGLTMPAAWRRATKQLSTCLPRCPKTIRRWPCSRTATTWWPGKVRGRSPAAVRRWASLLARYSAVNDAPVMKQIANQVMDVGGTLAFTALATDQDCADRHADLQPGQRRTGRCHRSIQTPARFSWPTVGVTPGRYFVTVEAHDAANLVDSKEVALTVFAPGERTALDDYVNAVDPAYKWDIRSRVDGDGFTKYNILLTSGTWRTAAEVNKPLWEHWMVVYVPDEILVDQALLFIDGGSNSTTPPTSSEIDGYAGPISSCTGSVLVDLFSIPSQPLTFTGVAGAKTEDAILAYSWKKYLQTGDETWPVHLPMTRAAMRAMDAVSDFLGSPVGGNFDLASFVVTGGSKRGWTTWLAAAVDPRVSEAIPIVSDLLNMEVSFVHHYAYYNGAFSAAVNDYVAEGVLNVNNFGTEAMDTLLRIVDPYTYLNRLTLPKFIVNASGDEFFVPDSWKYYYDALLRSQVDSVCRQLQPRHFRPERLSRDLRGLRPDHPGWLAAGVRLPSIARRNDRIQHFATGL